MFEITKTFLSAGGKFALRKLEKYRKYVCVLAISYNELALFVRCKRG